MRPLIPLVLAGLLLGAPLAGAMETTSMENVQMKGELGARWQAALGNIVTRTDRYGPITLESSASGTPGPLCLGLSSALTDVEQPWRVRQTSAGVELLDESGTPVSGLAPIKDDWLHPDAHDPNRLRVLFRE